MLLAGIAAFAQEMRWENVTVLTQVANGGNDPEHALQQYLLFDEDVLDKNRDVIERYRTFAEEYGQMMMNRAVPEALAAMEEQEKEIKKMIEQYPELKEQLQEALKDAERAKKELPGYVDNEVKGYSVDTKALLKDLTRLAVNKKAYTAWRDIDGGLFAVAEGRCYGPVSEDAFNRAKFEEGQEFTWGVIDASGKQIIDQKYESIRAAFSEYDIMFLYCKDASGKVRGGARGYDGRVRIPFEYDDIPSYNLEEGTVALKKDGKIGMFTFDCKQLQPFVYVYAFCQGEWLVRKEENGPLGVVSAEGKLVIPLKYKGDWDYENGEMVMMRYDGKLDVYNHETFEFIRTDPAPNMD